MDRRKALQEYQSAGAKVLGVLPGRYPRELPAALGLAHMELWDPPVEPVTSTRHLQPFVCSVVQRSLEQILKSTEKVDAYLYPHLCDSVQNLFTIVRDCIGDSRPAHLFYPPRNGADGQIAADYLAGHLRELAIALGESLGLEAADDEMVRAVRDGQRANDALAALYRARAEGGIAPSNAEFYGLVRQGEYRPLEVAADLWENSLTTLVEGPKGIPIVLSGLIPEGGLLRLLDEHRVNVVEDDLLSCGRRLLRDGYTLAADPYKSIASAFLAQPPCSSVASPILERGKFLMDLVARSGAKAIVFHTLKFCEMELFDHPFLVKWLKEQGVATIVLESELYQAQYGQMETRLEAFLEMIG
jgi:benzoyl-CoA reductase/2-hydroxyglutaryl-CoA dehydratase subunit BcrC/BadD/HgdB